MHTQSLLVTVGPGVWVVGTEIHNMTEPVTHDALRNSSAHMGTDSPVDQTEFFFCITIQWKAANQDETIAILDLIKNCCDIIGDLRHFKMFFFDVVQSQTLLSNVGQHLVESIVVSWTQIKCLLVSRGKIAPLPCAGMIDPGHTDRTVH